MAPLQLDYEPHDIHRRARQRRRLAILILSVLAIALACWRGPVLYRAIRVAVLERRVAGYVAPSGRVVYEEDPALWPSLLAQGGYRQRASGSPGYCSFVAYFAEPVQQLAQYGELRLGATAVFAHARRSPAGHGRVVVVWLAYNAVRANEQGATPDNQVNITFCLSVVSGGKVVSDRIQPLWIAPQSVAEDRATPLYARIYAGQADPADPSHFTIDYQIGEYNDVFDGYLRDDDTIVIHPRKHQHTLNPK